MIEVTDSISIDEGELLEEFVRSSGPGGQNVNKVETTAKLRFDVARSPSLSDEVRMRLLALAGRRASADGIITIVARRARTQAENRRAAQEMLVELIRRAARPPVPRHPTKPTAAARVRRLESKRRRSAVKRSRQGRTRDVE